VELPKTHYARSGDLAIAYQVHGAGELDLLFSGSTASNVETSWLVPEAARLFDRLGRFARVIRFDRRDSGCSDPFMADLTLEAHAADALAVMDAVGAPRPVLLGALDGGRSMAALAATHPERAGGLVTFAASPLGAIAGSPVRGEMERALFGADWPEGAVALFAPDWYRDRVRHERLAPVHLHRCHPAPGHALAPPVVDERYHRRAPARPDGRRSYCAPGTAHGHHPTASASSLS
jgi:pimeloyl-ACP methyl ester carboxylesterase